MKNYSDLMEKAVNGDKQSFIELIEGRKDMLYRTAFLYIKNQQDALEIVDITVYNAYLSIKKLKNPNFFNTWLTKILINASVDLLRYRKKVILLNDNYDTEYVLQDSSLKIDLYNAVDKLRGKYKTVIILKYYNNLKISEVAEVMECTESNVKNYIHKALKILIRKI
ncbi:RNA polymerase sigma factor SigV [Clostridium homopropionicum DSM 5847]|uniref:RNA polymerase sigma factor SigV n=1 Tax=Clostridium homopropionicum DSM 5847 TaxID=1121318 RepID=A0A0L6Z751_9CLOT|nr:sigma-70 family RNA polymerase sigma factor [Clostridium homopropionicum]KOA18653.1 RNA polymerase sigma factor SigV [Clostridium homopropionicum DSM 5847]SFG51510.1 RNA polymerase, sigma subunit, SigV [Clostridium homopropionicum]